MILNISTNSVYCNHIHDLSFPQFYPPPLQAQPSRLHMVSLTLPSSLSGCFYITGSFIGEGGGGVGGIVSRSCGIKFINSTLWLRRSSLVVAW